MRVLHVVEAMGGGIVPAILAMVEATPEIDHHLATWPRRFHEDTGDAWPGAFASVRHLPRDPLRATRDLRATIRGLGPDVVHAHSSYAGVLTRSAGLRDVPVAYSPHCFVFERRDLDEVRRGLFRRVEERLARRTDLLVAVSPHEAAVAQDLGHGAVARVMNRPLVRPLDRPHHGPRLRVVTAGRVCEQKDWRFLLAVKRHAEERLGVSATWEWIGRGDAAGEQALAAAGVQVTGWIPRAAVVRRLEAAQVYVHTAGWEGAPMSLLEAAGVGLPLAVRAIPALTSLAVPGAAPTVGTLATRIAVLGEPIAWETAHRASRAFAVAHSADTQGRQLWAAYARIVPGAVPSLDRAAASR